MNMMDGQNEESTGCKNDVIGARKLIVRDRNVRTAFVNV